MLQGPDGERIAAADFFQGPFTTARLAAELLTAVQLPPPPGARHGFCEVARRHGDFALAGAAVVVAPGAAGAPGRHARIALFSVAPCAFRATAAETALAAGAPAAEVAALAAAAAEPQGDIHATAAYRRQVAHVCVLQALAAAGFGSELGKGV